MSCACFGQGIPPLFVPLISRIWHRNSRYNVLSYDAVWADRRGRALSIKSEHWASGTGTSVPQPSIEPITFPCRGDALHVMPQTRDFLLMLNTKLSYLLMIILFVKLCLYKYYLPCYKRNLRELSHLFWKYSRKAAHNQSSFLTSCYKIWPSNLFYIISKNPFFVTEVI